MRGGLLVQAGGAALCMARGCRRAQCASSAHVHGRQARHIFCVIFNCTTPACHIWHSMMVWRTVIFVTTESALSWFMSTRVWATELHRQPRGRVWDSHGSPRTLLPTWPLGFSSQPPPPAGPPVSSQQQVKPGQSLRWQVTPSLLRYLRAAMAFMLARLACIQLLWV